MPTPTNTKKLTMILGDLLETLKNPYPALPLPEMGTELNTAICSLEKILNTSVEPHQPTVLIPAPTRAPTVATITTTITAPETAPITVTKNVIPAAPQLHHSLHSNQHQVNLQLLPLFQPQ